MKTKIYKTLTLAIYTVVLTYTANAQLPNFTKVDTGAITITSGGHASSACFDMDNDGDLDLLISNYGVFTQKHFDVYKNERNGFYVKTPRFISYSNDKFLRSIGDFDNDGDIDLLASNIMAKKPGIYYNNGYGYYQHDGYVLLAYESLYPSMIDINGDGYLDVVGIDTYGSISYNNGDGGFLDAIDLGLLHEPEELLLAGMSWGDCDNDGDMDFYGGYNYHDGTEPDHVSKNACFLNNGDGTFIKFDETSVIVEDSIGINNCVNWVDYDNDGDMDLYIVNQTSDTIDGPLNALYENLGNMQFTKHVFEDEMYRNSFKVSSVWGDLDNDADLDLYVTIENNVSPWTGDTSSTPYDVLYSNDGYGSFTNILDHTLAYEDSHTALMFDHDNDGDLDVLLTRYSGSNDGFCNLFVNEGNLNSWVVLTCEGTVSNRSAIGTRIYAKCSVNGKHITQTREITPINGHLTYANFRQHFGLGDADVIDTLLIRWPSGHVDEYLNVKANQFYRAIEDDDLEIDFRATNYIEYNPVIPDVVFENIDESVTLDLNEYFQFITGDTVPLINGDTLDYLVHSIENPDVVSVGINGSSLMLEAGTDNGESEIQLIADAGFTKRMESFTVSLIDGINTNEFEFGLAVYPNPFISSTTIEYEMKQPSDIQITICNHLGKEIEMIEHNQSQGTQQFIWNAEELPGGIYFCVLKTEKGTQTMKMIKLK